ncbi:flavin-containing monooxygenase, partial [Colletotrichum plurivorum]
TSKLSSAEILGSEIASPSRGICGRFGDLIPSQYLAAPERHRLVQLQLDTAEIPPHVERVSDGLVWITAALKFETKLGRGRAVVRLVDLDGKASWRAFSLYAALHEIIGSEEAIGSRRPQGGNFGTVGEGLQPTWQERREKQVDFTDKDPDVVIIGAGKQTFQTCLSALSLIQYEQAKADSMSQRAYRTLVLHDPVDVCHMPYLPFPVTWPLYTPKDKLADWLETYASVLELNVWTKSSIESAAYNDQSGNWDVKISRNIGGQVSVRSLKPRHVIMATGHAGEPLIPKFPGQGNFKGQVYHASTHTDTSNSDVKNRKVVVVGTGNSGHDIAQNYHENGADVTLIQRGGTVITADSCTKIMWNLGRGDSHPKPSLETGDLFGHSLPIPIQFAISQKVTNLVREADKPLLDGLVKAGFSLDFGAEGSGLRRQYLTRGGGYYIDVGCSQLIADELIKVKGCAEGIAGFDPTGLVLKNGDSVPADIVVMATGYDNMRTSVRKALGDSVANRCQDVWDLDTEGELNAVWRPSGHPGFWYMAGNLALCRPYSKVIALQIKARELGLVR